MWKIFRRDKYAIIERRKRREEKQRMRERSRARRRRKRAERWYMFRKRLNRFLTHPLTISGWKSTHRDPYASIDRRKQREEKKRMRERSRAHRRRKRTEQWQRFRRRINRFFVQPFSRSGRRLTQKYPYAQADRIRQREEQQRMRKRSAARNRRRRIERWHRFSKRLNGFLTDPFAKKAPTTLEREQKRIRRYKRHYRKVARQRWWIKFKKNPWKTLLHWRKRGSSGYGYYLNRMTWKERMALARKKRKALYENLVKAITTRDLRQKFGFSFMHSTAYFIFAFMLIWVIYQAVTIIVASSFKIPVIWYYYQLKFPLYTYSPLYTRKALVVIFAAGPIMSLMMAFLFLRLYFSRNRFLKRFRLFFLWGFIAGCNFFFGAYISGMITHTEFVYASEWFFMSNGFAIQEIILASVSLAMLMIIGRITTPLFLQSSGSVTLIKPEFRFFFILSQVIFPWLAGITILFLITLPNYYLPLIFKTCTPGLLLIPTMFFYNALPYQNIHKTGAIQHNYFRWSVLIAAVALLFFYRIILAWGLRIL
jgi:hypothetical protein